MSEMLLLLVFQKYESQVTEKTVIKRIPRYRRVTQQVVVSFRIRGAKDFVCIYLVVHNTYLVYEYSSHLLLGSRLGINQYGCQPSSRLSKQGINISLSPLAPERMVSRGRFRRPAPRQPAHSPNPG